MQAIGLACASRPKRQRTGRSKTLRAVCEALANLTCHGLRVTADGHQCSATPLSPARHGWYFTMRPGRPKAVSPLRSATAVQNTPRTREPWQSRQRLGVRAALRRFLTDNIKLLLHPQFS